MQAKMLKTPSPDGVVDFDSSADMESGEMVAVPDGRIGPRLGIKASTSGERVAVAVRGQCRLNDVEGATTFAAGDTVAWHTTNNNAVASGTAGSTDVGVALEATSAGGDPVDIELNQ